MRHPKICIIGGTGKMGQWFKGFFESRNIPVTIHSRRSRTPLATLVEESDIVIVSIPISEVSATIKKIKPFMNKNSLLTDISSLKVAPMKAMSGAPSGTLGMHPLFGPSVLDPQGLKIVFCHQKDNHHVDWLKRIFEEVGIQVISLDPDDHDKQMAVVQALTHALNILFAQTLTSQMKKSLISTPLFTLQTLVAGRVLTQKPELMIDIQQLNPHFLPVLEEFLKNTVQLLEQNRKKDREGLKKELIQLEDHTGDINPYALSQTNKVLTMLSDRPVTLSVKKRMISTKNLSIAYLGPEGTNTHQAAVVILDEKRNIFLSQSSLQDIMNAVMTNKADIGVVPAENSIHGTVRETLDLLSDTPVSVIGSFVLPIQHVLLSKETALNKIRRVLSHPQALAQCKEWLSKNLPKAELIPTASTTSALHKPEVHTAYIASEKASQIFKIPILAKNIQGLNNNTTKFYVVCTEDTEIPNIRRSRTLFFLTIHNRVGILRDILDIFAKNKINLTQLESRPSIEKMWDYSFYIEVDCDKEDKALQKAQEMLEKICISVRILGST